MDVLLDRYEVLGPLGSGGLAEILRVRDRAVPGRVVALKRQHAHIAHGELLAEFTALARVQHPNLPTIYDYHEDLGDGRPGYTLEEVVGETADRAVAASGPDSVPEIAAGLLRALAHIHSRGLTHGDLHPHNLIVGEARRVKVLDLSPGTPRSGGMAALPYLAPERLEGEAPSPRSDLFAVGVTLHRLLTGALPFPDYPHLTDDAKPAGGDALGPWKAIISALLERRPEERPPQASEVLRLIASATKRSLPLVTPEIVHATLSSGPTQPVGSWPGQLADGVLADLIERGRAGTVLVSGALGSGRTRALRELKWTLQAQSKTLVLATAAAVGDAAGAGLRRLLTQIPRVIRAGLPDELRAPCESLLDESLLAPDDQDPEKTFNLKVDLLARAFLWLGRRRPLAVLVDDVDAVDSVTGAVLRALTRYVAHRPDEAGTLALVAAGTPGEVLSELAADAENSAQHLSPPPFDSDAVAALLQCVFQGRTPTHRLVLSIEALSGGNPLVAGEAVSSAFEAGWLSLGPQDIDLAGDAPDPLPVPSTATDALVGRLSGVADGAWPLLALVASSSVPLPARLAGPALGVDDHAAGLHIAALTDRQVLRWELEEGEGRISVAAPSLRKAIRERGEVHRSVLTRLVTVDATSLSLWGRVVCAEAALALGVGDRRALGVCRELVDRGMAAEAILLLDRVTGDKARVLGDAHAALGHDEEALAAYSGLESREAAERMGVLLVRNGRYKEALEHLAPLAEDLGADTLRWLARAHMMQSDYDAALKTCEAAEAAADDALIPRIRYIRGLVHFYRGDYNAAREALGEAKKNFEAHGSSVDVADVINALGLVHFRQAELGPALDHFQNALKQAGRTGDRPRALITLMNVAVIHQERGEYGLAESRYNEALSMARVLGHRSGVMKVTQNLGNLYRYLGDLEQGLAMVRDSLGIALVEKNQYLASHNRTLIGEMAWLMDRAEEAELELTAALAGFNEVGSVNEAADCQRSLAQVALGRSAMSAAEAHAKQAYDVAEERGIPRLQILTRITRAEIERRKGGGDLQQALVWLREAHARLGDKPRPDLEWQVLAELHRVQRDLGDSQGARDVGQKALAALNGLASKLPEGRRETFLAVKNRREALRELNWLAGLKAGRGGEPGGQLGRLLEVNQRLNEELDLGRLLEYIIDSAILLTGAERGFLLMVDTEKSDGSLKVVIARNIDRENIRNKRYKVSYNIAEAVIESGEAALTTDAMADNRYSEYLSINHLKLRSVLCLPMMRGGKVLGALYVDNRFQSNAFTNDDLAFMDAFANQAAIAWTNARILEERQNAADELARSQAKVEELNAKLREQLAAKEQALKETEQMLVVQRRQLKKSYGYDSIVGASEPIRQVFHVLDRVCQSEISVLVTGESGTGKELVARAVHFNGPRKDRPFVAINCSSIPETLIESELFGHVRGAFTGATGDKKGVFEVAHRGTLFLDEIGEMPLEMQAKLLRALQDGEIQKVGSPRSVHVDVRIIAATNRNLRELIQKGSGFREDLYYRLAVVTIELPPLRTRPDDIPLLVSHFLDKNRRAGLGNVAAVSSDSMRLLMRYGWPGNVRELETVIKNASIFSESDTLQPIDFANFPNIVGTEQSGSAPPPNARTVRLLAELEREAIIHALEANDGNKKRTAEQLGIDRRTLYNKLAAYGISVERRAHVLGRDT